MPSSSAATTTRKRSGTESRRRSRTSSRRSSRKSRSRSRSRSSNSGSDKPSDPKRLKKRGRPEASPDYGSDRDGDGEVIAPEEANHVPNASSGAGADGQEQVPNPSSASSRRWRSKSPVKSNRRKSKQPDEDQEQEVTDTEEVDPTNVYSLITAKGRQYVRLFEFDRSPRRMLLDGFAQRDRTDSELNQLGDRRKVSCVVKNVQIFRALFEIDTPLYNHVLDASPDEFEKLVHFMKAGQTSARSSDAGRIREKILDYITFPVREDPKTGEMKSTRPDVHKKEDRGFENDTTSTLLCPVQVKEMTPEYREKLRLGSATIRRRNGVEAPVLGYIPRKFAFVDGKCEDENNTLKGFLKGPIPLKSFAAIFHGPRSAISGDRIVDIFAHGKPGVAQIYAMKSVTVGSIAYAASMAFYGLSSDRAINKCTAAIQLYRGIHRNFDLDDSTSKEINEDLLAYYNSLFFPSSMVDEDDEDDFGFLADIQEYNQSQRESQAHQELAESVVPA